MIELWREKFNKFHSAIIPDRVKQLEQIREDTRLRKIKRGEYEKSREWKTKQKFWKAAYDNKCQDCGATGRLICHHLHYDRYCLEEFDDIKVLCKKCENQHHKERLINMFTPYEIRNGELDIELLI